MPLRSWARKSVSDCLAVFSYQPRTHVSPFAGYRRGGLETIRDSHSSIRRAVSDIDRDALSHTNDAPIPGRSTIKAKGKLIAQPVLADTILPTVHTKEITHSAAVVEGVDSQLAQYVGILQRGHRLHGSAFVVDSWKHIKEQKTDLPVDGPVADQLWRLLCEVPELHSEIFDYACDLRYRRGEVYDALYEVILKHVIQIDAANMRAWHERFQKEYWMPTDCLAQIARLVVRSTNLIHVWKQMYRTSEPQYHCTYDLMIGTLMQKGLQGVASEMHNFLIEHGDAPSKEFMTERYGPRFQHVRLATLRDNDKITFAKLTKKTGKKGASKSEAYSKKVRFPGQDFDNAESDLINSDNGAENPFALFASTQPQGLSDELTARLFATRAFSVDTIIKGLSIFGSPVIGPLSLRQICTRLECDPAALAERLDLISKFEITLIDTAFTRLINHFVDHGNGDMLRSLIKGNFNPLVFEERSSLDRLLAATTSDAPINSKAVLVAAAEVLYPVDSSPEDREDIPGREGVDAVIQRLARNRNHNAILAIIRKMHSKNLKISSANLRDIWQSFFTKRKSSKRPILFPRQQSLRQKHQGVTEHAMIIGIMLTIAKNGSPVPAWRWTQLLITSGMADSFSNTARLCHQIVALYAPEGQTSLKLALGRRVEEYVEPLQAIDGSALQRQREYLMQVFSPEAQSALVTWGFRAGVARINEAKAHGIKSPDNIYQALQPCLQGLRLLRDLSAVNVYIDPPTIREAVKQRIWQALGPGVSSRKHNRLMVDLFDRLSHGNRGELLEILLRAVEEEWVGAEPLFPELWDGQERRDVEPSDPFHLRRAVDSRSTLPAPLSMASSKLPQDHPRRKPLDSLPQTFLLSKEARTTRRKFLMYSLFGETPRFGGVRNLRSRNAGLKARRLSRAEWNAWVDAWARDREPDGQSGREDDRLSTVDDRVRWDPLGAVTSSA